MLKPSHFFNAITLICAAIMASTSSAAPAQETSNESWIKDEISLDGTAQVYLSPVFGAVKGRFKAVPESIIDNKDSIDGNFVLGEYRYLFKKPAIGEDGTLSDELISTEILDCEGNFFGTMKQVRKYKGKVVNHSATAASDVTMIQTTAPNLGSKLCALYQKKKGRRLERKAVTNPSYSPRKTKQDIDRLIDKYDVPGARNTK